MLSLVQLCNRWIYIVAIVCTLGCGAETLSLVDVSGTVTYRGKPVSNATITFYPKQGPPAFGVSDAQGQFSLETNGQPGAVPETAKVSVVAVEELRTLPPSEQNPEGLTETRSLIPSKYSLIATTPLEAEVSATGQNRFEFQLAD